MSATEKPPVSTTAIQSAHDDLEAIARGSDDAKHDSFVWLKRHASTVFTLLQFHLCNEANAAAPSASASGGDKTPVQELRPH